MQAPLKGIRVVAVEQYMSAPYCTMLLADAGAEVIKVEQPRRGDPRRGIGPFATDGRGNETSGGFMAYNRNKKSLTLDLQKPEGRQVLFDLAKVADVVVENLRPGVAEKLGTGYEEMRRVNPRLIYAAISGFGRSGGPYWQRPAFDIVVEAMSGIMNIVGFEDREPITTLYGMPDIYSGLVAAYGITLALIQRGVAGEGQFLDISMYDSMISLNERSVVTYSFTGEVPGRGRERLAAPRAAFKARDGYVALSCPTDDMWARLARLMGREELISDPATATGPARAECAESFLRPLIEEWLADKSREEATQLLLAGGVPAGPVQTTEDVFRCPQVAERGMLLEIEDDVAGQRKVARTPVRGSAMPEPNATRPPRLGEHNEEILTGLLGYDATRLDGLRSAGAI
ncbi:MAG: CoA transferase [Bacteroidetes bacterium]|nr:CoA transferase [Bacteroidota bacterium]